jgi:hypothetical protein
VIREAVVRLAQERHDQGSIAAALPAKPTQTAVWKALALQRRMSEMQLASPYIVLHDPPADCSKLRRHKNNKYQFRPLEGYERPAL